jgi:hypothetical protein
MALMKDPRFAIVFTLIVVWSLVWKGIALWRAGRSNHKIWFIVLLVANTVGILEILYIYFFSKCCKKEEKPLPPANPT